MSQENVEVVRRFLEVGASLGAARGFDVAADLLGPDIECIPPESAPTAGVYRGLDEVRALIRQWTDLFEDFGFDPERLVNAGDQVVVFGRQRGRGKTSGMDIGEGQAHVYTFREGRIVLWQMFLDRREALEAAGLSEQDAHGDS